MKKGIFGCFGCIGVLVVLIIIIAIIVAIFGGGSDSNSDSKDNKTQEANIGDKVKVDKLEYTVNSVDTANSVGNQYISSNADGQYIVADVTVKNNGDEAITIDTELFKILNGDSTSGADSSASSNANTSQSGDIGFFLEKLNPDNEKTGKVVFDVSEKTAQSDNLKLQVQSGFFGSQKANINIAQ